MTKNIILPAVLFFLICAVLKLTGAAIKTQSLVLLFLFGIMVGYVILEARAKKKAKEEEKA